MRVLLSSNHRYPGGGAVGSGLQPREWPSGSGFIVHDLIAKGLAELGHDVFYLLPKGAASALPPGVTLIKEPVLDVDVLHTMTFRDHALIRFFSDAGIACVNTCHLDPTVPGRTIPDAIEDNWIFVSKTLAQSLGRSRYVCNGIDPADFIYSESKSDYFLFLASLEWAHHKGLDVALRLAQRAGVQLVVAGTAKTAAAVAQIAQVCREPKTEFVGDVRGREKAELLAHARGLLFPTQVNEAFGLAMAEALMSGTPVICSARGACPEIVSECTGFVCHTEQDYMNAVERIDEIEPSACRARALQEFHYHRMARDYVREYRIEMGTAATGGSA